MCLLFFIRLEITFYIVLKPQTQRWNEINNKMEYDYHMYIHIEHIYTLGTNKNDKGTTTTNHFFFFLVSTSSSSSFAFIYNMRMRMNHRKHVTTKYTEDWTFNSQREREMFLILDDFLNQILVEKLLKIFKKMNSNDEADVCFINTNASIHLMHYNSVDFFNLFIHFCFD